MPIYLYRCPQCRTEREVLKQSVSDVFYGENCDKPGCVETVGRREIPTMMERVPTAASFTIGGYNAKNGYSK